MKKLLITTAIVSLFSATSSFAKTEGHYVGLDIIQTEIEDGELATNPNVKVPLSDSDSVSLGVNYGYAFNFSKIFLVPELFYDYSNVEAKDISNYPINLNQRYGAKLNLGYDITEKFAIFGNVGIAVNDFEYDFSSVSGYGVESDKVTSALFGLGLKYNVANNVSLKVSYEVSSLDPRTPSSNDIDYDFSVIRVGAAYNF